MEPRRWLVKGATAFVVMASLLIFSLFASNANAMYNEADWKKLAELKSYLDEARFDGVDEPTDLLPDWYTAWRIVLQNQIDRLFMALENRPAAKSMEPEHGDETLRVHSDDGLGFKVHIVGDSTMRMQANVLSWVLSQRTTRDGSKQCVNACKNKSYGDCVDIRCTGTDEGVDGNGNPPEGQGFVFNLQFTKEVDACVPPRAVDADFVYFGCGMHFLQLVPDVQISKTHLDVWVHYEHLLEEAVMFFRSGGGNAEKRVPVGEAFMTSHSFAIDRLAGEYAILEQEYLDGNQTLLETCREKANSFEQGHLDWTNEFEPEEICTLGIFSDSGISNLNQRAEEVMDRLGVPIVQGYDITAGQSWATPIQDGRHYPAMIPLEINSFMSEIATLLRRERREAAV